MKQRKPGETMSTATTNNCSDSTVLCVKKGRIVSKYTSVYLLEYYQHFLSKAACQIVIPKLKIFGLIIIHPRCIPSFKPYQRHLFPPQVDAKVFHKYHHVKAWPIFKNSAISPGFLEQKKEKLWKSTHFELIHLFYFSQLLHLLILSNVTGLGCVDEFSDIEKLAEIEIRKKKN